MKETCPTCAGHGFVFSLMPVSAPPKPIDTDEDPPKKAKGNKLKVLTYADNLSHLRKL